MTAALLRDLRAEGVQLKLVDDVDPTIRVLDPREVLTHERLVMLSRHKPQLVSYLQRDRDRREAAGLIRLARHHGFNLGVAMRDAWHERLAICTVDGLMSEAQAAEVALAELWSLMQTNPLPQPGYEER
ncbi:hypothetical protein [Mucisphaera sp.]|uniref:hypothetical protein n=1 Tax=Mucisphaera sp. TaxID=2913024 RepID=UPI003D0A5832